MKISLIVERNCEDLAKSYLKNEFGVIGSAYLCNVECDVDEKTLSAILYKNQCARRIILSICSGEFKDLKDIKEKINKSLPENIIEKLCDKSFRVVVDRDGNHLFNSLTAQQEISNTIFVAVNNKKNVEPEINLKNPDLIIYVNIIDNQFSAGVDILKTDLSKRSYKVFNHPSAIKGTTAFNLLLFAEAKKGKTIIDPLSSSGIVTIEAAFQSANFPLQFFDKPKIIKNVQLIFDIDISKQLKNLDLNIDKQTKKFVYAFDASFSNISWQKKNAKIAGVEKFIEFSKKQPEDVDLKFKEKSVDIVISKLIEPSKKIVENKARKIYELLFERVKLILKKTGNLTFMLRNPELLIDVAEKYGFSVCDKKTIFQGEIEHIMIKFKL